ncbi:transcriptional regulator, AraC family [Devosia lucknowensis]|uniref:Transcriptional regulator, AraC family n=1 Tax=Devosia lucknowensis TaxID=1096929 RepID=A0A1Y6G7U6_9HYPH|nr:helix-turn-helix domain-containing protein [Devosia lucknowensis]SMQ85403.1 transcriptional regulator, AraC family [Devosia lucknowensis]
MRSMERRGTDRAHLDLAIEVESQAIATTLDVSEWTLLGRRNRIFVLPAGTGTINYAGEVTAIQSPTLVWIPTGKPAQLTLQAGSRGAWLAISDALLGQVALPGNIAEDIRRLSQQPQLGTRIERDLAGRLITLFATMESELRDNRAGAQEMVRHQLAIVSILLWRSSDISATARQPAPRALVNNFLRLVDQQMRGHWSVADYARYLGVSVDRLNTAVMRATGQSPLALIHGRLMSEARQMLENSGMHIAEIALSLGFDDPAYFSRFFKRLSGRSPRQYRLEAIRSHVDSAGSFAAWP